MLVVPAVDLPAVVEGTVLPAVWRIVRERAVPKDFDWADIVCNQIHLVHELVLADMRVLQDSTEEMGGCGLEVPRPTKPDQASASPDPRGTPVHDAATGPVPPERALVVSDTRWEELVRHFGGGGTGS